MKRVRMLCEWEQLCAFSPAMKLLILHLGTRSGSKAQLRCTAICIIRACAFELVWRGF